MMKIVTIVGTRPNFIKITRFKEVAEKHNIDLKILHTGQHYDDKMSKVFFRQFGLEPDHYIHLESKPVAHQIGQIITELSDYFSSFKPDLVLVVGDVNSTLAASIAGHKSGIKIGHIESGLRSFDRGMPEEINRILTDEITDLFFVTEPSGIKHLKQEGKDSKKIHFVGNTMIDTLIKFEPEIEAADVSDFVNVQKEYCLMTMHRPATVDNKKALLELIDVINFIVKNNLLILPLHPRTEKNLKNFSLWEKFKSIKNLNICPPVGYFEFQKLIKNAKFILTDSGGIQEEATFRKVPCITLRPNTERPVTITEGTNELCQLNVEKLSILINSINNGTYKKGNILENWDGKATERIFEVIVKS